MYLRAVLLLHLALVLHFNRLLDLLLFGSLLIIEEEVIAYVVAQEHEECADHHWQDCERSPYQVYLHL
jgi:hypothetical protein